MIFIEQGKHQIRVTERVSPSEIRGLVIAGGRLTSNAALEAPGLKVACPALTEKDKEDVAFLLALQPAIDYIAMSFVQNGDDVQSLRDLLDRSNTPRDRRPKICPRIERPSALRNLDSILDKSDGMIVARGELGFELSFEDVPFAQKVMMHAAKTKGTFPVMVSTQLMESMIYAASPTRAEVSDVVNAVFDGADVLMLSGETAKGQYPVESVMAMAACARVADAQKPFDCAATRPSFHSLDVGYRDIPRLGQRHPKPKSVGCQGGLVSR
jgi:pyruvate kinase